MAELKTFPKPGLLPYSESYSVRVEAGLSRKTWLALAGVVWFVALGYISF